MIILFAITSIIYLWMVGHNLIKYKEIKNITLQHICGILLMFRVLEIQ